MNPNIAFAFAAGLGGATYTIFMRMASTGVHPALGAMIVTGVAFAINGAVTLGMKLAGQPISFNPSSFWFLALAGLGAAGVDLFTLLAYSGGMKVTSSFIIGATITVAVLLVGFLVFKEPFTLSKLIGIALIFAGGVMLQREGL